MKKNKFEIVNTVLLVLIVVLQVVTMLWLFMRPSENTSTSSGTFGESGNSQVFAENDALSINTPYATLQYPAKWKDYLKYEGNAEEGSYAMTFYCELSGQQVELFSVFFGMPEKGELIGYVTKDSAQISFTVDSTAIERSDWSQEEYNILCTMQEDINVLINSVDLT